MDMENSTAKNLFSASGCSCRPRSRLRTTWMAVRGRDCAMVSRKNTT